MINAIVLIQPNVKLADIRVSLVSMMNSISLKPYSENVYDALNNGLYSHLFNDLKASYENIYCHHVQSAFPS